MDTLCKRNLLLIPVFQSSPRQLHTFALDFGAVENARRFYIATMERRRVKN